MSASAIADALKTMLTASSALGSGGADTHYGVMESTAGSCAVISWRGVTSEAEVFGDVPGRMWTFLLDGYVKDTGDPLAVMTRTLSMVDAILGVLEGDYTVQGQGEWRGEIRGERIPDVAFDIGGATWLRMPIEVDIKEWPDG